MEYQMEKLNQETKKLMDERFGHDSVIALATQDGDMPACAMSTGIMKMGHFMSSPMRSQTKCVSSGKIPI